MKGLEGIRVVDLTMYVFAPAATAFLADHGAEVIKIEDVGGDPQRYNIPSPSTASSQVDSVYFTPCDVPWTFHLVNRGKKSLTLDLRQEEGTEAMHKLIATADVFASNLRNSALNRMRLDYATLSRINPRLIYVHASGYGERGRESERPGYDYSAFWARGGFMAHLGQPEDDPSMTLPGMGDMISGLVLGGAIGTALYIRERTGKGQKVCLSLLGTALWQGGLPATNQMVAEEQYPRLSRRESVNPIWNFYQAKDGKWIQLVCMPSERYWPGFCKAIGREDLRDHPRFDSRDSRRKNNVELIALLDEVFKTKTAEEWWELLDQNDALWAPVQTYGEVVKDPQVLANGYIAEVEHPKYGKVKLVGTPVEFSETPASVERPGPEVGQDNQDLLAQLGYSGEQIRTLREKKVIS